MIECHNFFLSIKKSCDPGNGEYEYHRLWDDRIRKFCSSKPAVP